MTCESDQLCGESPQLGFVIPFGNNKEREHPNWALRVDRAWLQGNSPSTEIAQTGRARQKWCVLVALCPQEGDALLQLQRNEGWGGGSDGQTGMSVQGR